MPTLCTDHSPTLDFHSTVTARPRPCFHFHSSHLSGNWASSLISAIYAPILLGPPPFSPRKQARRHIFHKFANRRGCVYVWAGGSQLNKQTLSLGKLSGFLEHLASIQGTLQFCVFNSQLYNRLHHTCCAQKEGGERKGEQRKGER